MILPKNGRIVVIDDDPGEGQPLVDALVSAGHLATFFTHQQEHMPENPLSGIRVVFLDLILGTEYQQQKTVTSVILNVMNRILDKKENGPFFLIAWTNKPEEVESVENALREDGFQIVAATAEKSECKDEAGEFSTQLIKERVDRALEKGAALQMFILWENCVHVAAGKIVRQFSSLAGEANDWNEQADLVVAKLAESLLGKHFDPKQTKPSKVPCTR